RRYAGSQRQYGVCHGQLELEGAGAVLSWWPGTDVHTLRTADAADPLRGGTARPARRPAQPDPVLGLRCVDGLLLRHSRHADGAVRSRPQPAGTPAISLGTGALRRLLRGIRPGHV